LSWVPGSTTSDPVNAEDKIGPLPRANIESTEATPAATEGKLIDPFSCPADSSGETETEPELPELPPNTDELTRKLRSDSNYSTMSIGSTTPKEDVFLPAGRKRSKTVSMHDLSNRFFRKPVIVLSKIDIFR